MTRPRPGDIAAPVRPYIPRHRAAVPVDSWTSRRSCRLCRTMPGWVKSGGIVGMLQQCNHPPLHRRHTGPTWTPEPLR